MNIQYEIQINIVDESFHLPKKNKTLYNFIEIKNKLVFV